MRPLVCLFPQLTPLQVFAFAQTVTISIASDHGLGQHVEDLKDSEVAQMSKVSLI